MFNVVPASVIQGCFRQGFTQWGLPQGCRLDNGQPWGGWSDLPKPLALWLVGLGIDRLTMILTGARTLREVVLFPAMRD